jgi:chorismate dehydratase
MTSVTDISTPILLRADCGLGQIDFVNCLPITRVLRRERPEGVRLVMGSPGDLNRQYKEKTLDLGAMSSAYFLEDGEFELFPDLSISSKGPVGSVLFYSRADLGGQKNLKIAVPQASASSVQLLKILLAQTYGMEAKVLPHETPDLVDGVDGFLLFGDRALTFDQSFIDQGLAATLLRLDLGQWWFEEYKLPMVFGVWAARRSWIKANPDDYAAVSQFLRGSKGRWFGQDFEGALDEASKRTGLSRQRLEHYFRQELDYAFTDEHRRGLELYDKICKEL